MDFSEVKAITIPEGNVYRILSGTTVLWERTGLPTEYQQVEYLEATGTQYIDTGIYPVLSDGLYAKLQYISGDLNNYRPFGGYNPGVAIDSVTGLRIWTLNNFSISPTNKMTDGNIHTIQCSEDGTWDYDGETVLASKPIQDQTGVTITLFKANYIGGVLYGTGTSRMYAFRYFRNGETIRDFVPCYRKSDSVAGLYDVINDVFYTNAGSGTFTVGPDL